MIKLYDVVRIKDTGITGIVVNISSMNKGVVAMGDKTYGLGYEGTTAYAPRVWKMGDNTKWTNPNTLPQWYYRTFEKHHTELTQLALKNAESELR